MAEEKPKTTFDFSGDTIEGDPIIHDPDDPPVDEPESKKEVIREIEKAAEEL